MKIVALGQALIRHPLSWSDDLRALVEGADAVLCNFEGCIAPPDAYPMKTKTVHPAPPSALTALAELGVTHLALANNHIWDYGPASVLATRQAAVAAGFATSGAGRDLAEASAAAIRSGVAMIAADVGPTPDWAIARASHPGVNPLRLSRRLALPKRDLDRLAEITEATGASSLARRRQAVGYDKAPPGQSFYGLDLVEAEAPAELWQVDPADLERLIRSVEALRGAVDHIVVSLHYHHWSAHWQSAPDWLSPISTALAEAGATALFGHGPPVAYPLSLTHGMPVAPGLGNLVFHTARGATYDREGVPVWRGGALVLGDGAPRVVDVDVLRPPGL